MFLNELESAASEFDIDLTGEQLDKFDLYCNILLKWNKKINLTRIIEPKEIAVKHIIDSLSVWKVHRFPEDGKIIDVGTGAGFPGIPLKILCPSLNVVLLDSLGKRVRFLQEVTHALGLARVECIHARAEDAAHDALYREQFDLAASRAVARLSVLSELCLPFVRVGGAFAAMKGTKYEEESREAGRAIRVLGGGGMECHPVRLPGLSDKRAVVIVRKERPTPPAYPRKAGTPERKPL